MASSSPFANFGNNKTFNASPAANKTFAFGNDSVSDSDSAQVKSVFGVLNPKTNGSQLFGSVTANAPNNVSSKGLGFDFNTINKTQESNPFNFGTNPMFGTAMNNPMKTENSPFEMKNSNTEEL